MISWQSFAIITVDGYIIQGLTFNEKGYFVTIEELRNIDIMLEEGETYMELYNEAAIAITKTRNEVKRLESIFKILETENKGLRVQRVFFGLGGIGLGIGLTILLSNFFGG